ncbi:hypothetical protein B0H16DRAFT_1885841 [Mycena metata]|uniref:Uncharacterized protein n=1 Tax=Mycena metata TaxID=1033252 RepID=A0AAD7NE79_9AGAR|nr:hypothetical protein B0H16DRAFT_1885841 [Mycena metata]
MADDSTTNSVSAADSPPPIWAHLYVLEKWAQYTHRRQIPTTLDHKPSALQDLDRPRAQPNNPFRRAADGIALICATPKATTACALEYSVQDAQYTIRLACDDGFLPEQLAAIRQLLGFAARAVDGVDWNVDSRSTRGKMLEVTHSFLVDVAGHCFTNIVDLSQDSWGRRSLQYWISNQTSDVLTRVPAERREDIFTDLDMVSRPIPSSMSPDDLCSFLILVAGLVPVFQKYELHNPMHSYGGDSSPEPEEDGFPLIPDAAVQYIHELDRYFQAAKSIIACFANLSRKMHGAPVASSFRVEFLTPPPNASPSEGMEPEDLDSYLTPQFHILSESLVTEKVGVAKDKWAAARDAHTLSYHAEMQLAIFYALNPEILPLSDYIGLSQPSCGLCDFVLRALQKSTSVDVRYSPESTGLPIQLSTCGTHGRIHPHWRFPDIDHFTTSMSPEQAKVRRRLNLVREELAEYLRGLVKEMLPEKSRQVVEDKWGKEEDVSKLVRAKIWARLAARYQV